MIISPDILRRDTIALIKQIETQIEEVTREAMLARIDPSKMRDSSGNWVMIPLLLAKAQAYSTLVLLQQKK